VTPQDLYAMLPETVNHCISTLYGCFYSHLPEAGELESINGVVQTRIEFRILMNYQVDERRLWRLATVWFDDSPVMIIQNAGREGDDYARRFVTDDVKFEQMVLYVLSIKQMIGINTGSVVDPQTDIPELTEFYNHSLAFLIREQIADLHMNA
jgi:hypothetical protein